MNEQSIFAAALAKKSIDDRKAFLDEACGQDAGLRAQVEELLAANAEAGSFLEHPPAGLDVTIDANLNGRDTVEAGQLSGSLPFLEPCDIPDRIGKLGVYEIIEVVGQGGMGSVLRAWDTKLSRIVAVKVMAPELAANPTAVKRFLREARSAAAVVHDHVVTIHAIDDISRPPYLVMEFIQGQTLDQKIDREGTLELRHILRIGSQMAAGLAAAHRTGLIHRDVKPGNILLENGIERVKITDFGLARAADDVEMTRAGMIAGTPQYMSPEQAHGDQIDYRSDLFSLGSVLYTMCTGRPPFRAETTMGTLRRVAEDTPRPIHEVNAETPDWLQSIVMKLLAKNPDERFQSAKEVAELLEQHLAHLQQPGKIPLPPPVQLPAQTTRAVAPAPPTDAPLGWFVPAVWGIGLALLLAIPVYSFLVLLGPVIGSNLPTTLFATSLGCLGLLAGTRFVARRLRRRLSRTRARIVRALSFSFAYLALGLVIGGYLSRPNEAYVAVGANDPDVRISLTSEANGTSYLFQATDEMSLPAGTYRVEAACGPAHTIDLVSIDDPVKSWGILESSVRRTFPQGKSKYGIQLKLAERDHATIIVRVATNPSPQMETAAVREKPALREETVWTPLLNGKDLAGWNAIGGTPSTWKVENGILRGAGSPSYLISDKSYSDFHLKTEMRINPGGEWGMRFRTDPASLKSKSPRRGLGVEFTFKDSTNDVEGHMRMDVQLMLDEKLLAQNIANLKPNDWFSVEVIARGDLVDIRISDGSLGASKLERKIQAGPIILQLLDANSALEFRKIEISE